MQEIQILNAIDSITMGKLSFEDKALVVAHVKASGVRVGSDCVGEVMKGVDELCKGMYKEAQSAATYFQDFHEVDKYPEPFVVIGQDKVHLFLDKMLSKKYEGEFFADQWEFYHPPANMRADGLARNYWDFQKK